MRVNMMNSSSRKAGVVAVAAFGIILASGSIGVPLIGAEDMPEGFKKGELAPEPSAEMIEAGKRVYFTSVCGVTASRAQAMGLAPIVSGPARATSIKARSRSGTPRVESFPSSIPGSPFRDRMTSSRP
jgi:hypothetical protein